MKLKSLIASAAVVVSLLSTTGLAFAASASGDLQDVCNANPNSELCKGYNKGTSSNNTNNPVINTISNIVKIMSFVAGALAVFMVIYGGFKYITSAGDSGKVTSAKNTIIYALVGIVVIVVSRQIILYILSRI